MLAAKNLPALRAAIEADAQRLAFAEVGADTDIANLLNDDSEGVTVAEALFGVGTVIDANDVSRALEASRLDAAVAALKEGRWPALMVCLPPERLDAEGITEGHLLMAKIDNEGAEPVDRAGNSLVTEAQRAELDAVRPAVEVTRATLGVSGVVTRG